MKWVFLAIAITAEVIATSALKESEGFTRLIPSFLTISMYGVSFYFLALTLKEINMGIAYAIWAGSGIVLITFIGLFRFNQKLDIPAFTGIAFIVTGVIIMNVFSKNLSH